MDKENVTRRSAGYAAALALRRKQEEGAAAANNGGAPLPRVAAIRSSQQHSPSKDGKQPSRSASSLKNSRAPSALQNPAARSSSSVQRMGFKPATHSTRSRMPLLDAHAPLASSVHAPALSAAPLAASSLLAPVPVTSSVQAPTLSSTLHAASSILVPAPITSSVQAPTLSSTLHAASSILAPAPITSSVQMPALSSAPATSSILTSGIIVVEHALDSEEQRLQAELALYDKRLELLQSQQWQRRMATPAPSLPVTPSVSAAATDMQQAAPSVQPGAPQPAMQPAPSNQSQQTQEQQGMPGADVQQGAQQQERVPEQPPVPPEELSIVRSVTAATGTGCRDVIAAHASTTLPAGACWTSRGHRVLQQESSCILQLFGRQNADVTLRITFADPASVPRLVRLEHAPSPTAAFERLGDIRLQPKSLKQLRHLFRLGKALEVQRYLRITLVSHLAADNSGAHRVSHMLLTSGQGPQRSRSQQSGAASKAGAVASANGQSPDSQSAHSKPEEHAQEDSAASAAPEPPTVLDLPNAVPAAPSQPAATVAAVNPRVPPLPLAAVLGIESAAQAAASSATGAAVHVPPLPLAAGLGNESAAQAGAPLATGAAVRGPGHGLAAPSAAPSVQPTVPAAQLLEAPASCGDPPDTIALAVPPIGMPAPATLSAATNADSLEQLLAPPCPIAQKQAVPDCQVPDSVWSQLADVPADVDFELLHQEFVAQGVLDEQHASKEPTEHVAGGDSAPGIMLLPMQRCADVSLCLARLNLTPQEATEVVLNLFESGPCGASAALPDEQVDELLTMLPSADERQLMLGYCGDAKELSSAEQFLLEVARLVALDEALEARRFSSHFASQTEAVQAAAALLSSACQEVQQSDMLCTVLKVAMLAANFLNAGNHNGTAAGFQIDALLKLKAVRSTRARSRTLLHFVAREVARLHPDGASLNAVVPSAAAASQLDLAQAKAGLLELADCIRRVEESLALVTGGVAAGNSSQDASITYIAAFHKGAAQRLQHLQSQMDQAESAFKRLGTFINGQRSTMESPAAFFGVLHAFAIELDAAHDENSSADAAAASAPKPAGSSKDRQQRRRTVSVGGGGITPITSTGSGQAALRLASTVQAGSSHSIQQASQPCISDTATSGGNRMASSSATGLQPADRGASKEQAACTQAASGLQSQQEGEKLSTPVACLLAESARILSSIDCGSGGFGSTVASDATGTSSNGNAGVRPTATVPPATAATATSSGTAAVRDDVMPQAAAAEPAAAAAAAAGEADASFSTPREVALRWQGHPQEAGEQQQQQLLGQDGGAPMASPQQWQPRYTATQSAEEEVPATGDAPHTADGGNMIASGTLALSQLRQRTLQQLSPTSTPLSSLGRQSSRGSIYSSSNGSTPCSSVRLRGSVLQHSTSPLGLAAARGMGAAVAAAEAAATAARKQGAAAAPVPPGAIFSPELTSTPGELPPTGALSLPPNSGPSSAVTAAVAPLSASEQPVAVPVGGRQADQLPAAACRDDGGLASQREKQQQQQEVEEQHEQELEAVAAAAASASGRVAEQQQAGFDTLHATASSIDLNFYAPLAVAREGQQAHMSASLACNQGSGGAWAPLAAQHRQASSTLCRTSLDDLALLPGLVAAAAVGSKKHVSFSLPSSPRGGGAGRRPPPLNLSGVANKLQAPHAAGAGAPCGSSGSGSHAFVSQPATQQQEPLEQQPSGPSSPTLDALLRNVPAPPAATQVDLTHDDIADLAGVSSDHEVEWQQLELIQQRQAQWQQQLLLEREQQETLLVHPPVQLAQHAAPAQQQPAATEHYQLHHKQHQPQGAQAQPPLWASRVQLAAWITQQELAAALQQVQAQEARERAALQQLPSPITAATRNMDAAVARLVATAGNTPSGPLARGMRGSDAFAHTRSAVPSKQASAGHQTASLLEPVMPPPLAEGIRASQTMLQHAPAAALRQSVEGATGLQRGPSMAPPEAALSLEAAAWAAQEDAARAAAAAAAGGLNDRAVQAAGQEGGHQQSRRQRLRGLLGRQ